jgi:alkanesulfonate monooxygenase SsuD/methylene tetrahydromethanopterin reductase-like flavin-dependent oxidoreductase (luciferase family)
MRFGLFSNGQRLNQVAKTSYDEDLSEVVLADRLGIHEAWLSEHGTFLAFQAPDQLPSADLFICKAAALTRHIKMGPGIRPLPYFHPLQVATDAAVCDHLTGGRYYAGFGVGTGGGSTPQRGPFPGDQRAMFREAVDMILKAWTAEEPFDWNGQFWPGQQLHIIPHPLTKPHMDVGVACSRTEGTLELTAQKGFMPLMIWNTPAGQIKDMIEVYLRAGLNAPRPARRSRVRVARFVHVADSVKKAKRELHGADLGGAWSAGRLDHCLLPGDTRDDITIEYLIDRGLCFCGDPDTVYDRIKSFYDDVGGFGVLMLVTGKDWGSHKQRRRSMRRFMKEVAPRLASLEPAPAEVKSRG